MGFLQDVHGCLVATHQFAEGGKIRVGIGGIGEDEGGIGKSSEKPVESILGSAFVGERSEGFRDLTNLRIHHEFLALPVTGQTFEEVVAFDVAVVIGARDVGRIHVNQIAALLHVENVSATA